MPWWLAPGLEPKRRRLAKQIDGILRSLVRRKFNEHQAKLFKNKPRTVLSLSLQGIDVLTPEGLSNTSDQLLTFFFAGYDTTSILLAWLFYELSRCPLVNEKVRKELEELFGSDPDPAIV